MAQTMVLPAAVHVKPFQGTDGYIREFLCLVPHNQKFCFSETADVLHRSASTKEDFSGYRAASAWNAIGAYAGNLLAQPWRKEYREMKMFGGFYTHEIDSNLVGAERMLMAMGYKLTSQMTMMLEGPIDPDRVSNVSRDSLVAFVECQMLKSIWEEISSRFNCSWLEVLEFRENHICSPELAVRGLMYRYHQRQYHEQQLAALDVYGTARFHHPIAPNPACIYGQPQPLGYFYPPYATAAPPHSYTQPRFPTIVSPQHSIPPSATYSVPSPIHPTYHQPSQPILKSQDLYPSNGHHNHNFPAALAISNIQGMHMPMQNGYTVNNRLPPPTQPIPIQNYNCPVPTGKLIELDVSSPPQQPLNSSSETAQTYSATDSSSSVLIPRTVRHHNTTQHQPNMTLKRNDSDRHQEVYNKGNSSVNSQQQHTSHYSSQQHDGGKPKEEGVGTFESWDYVFRDLESQGYNKDLGERPDILSRSPEFQEARHTRQQTSANLELEQTLMELRLEECNRKAMPNVSEHRNLKINEALQKIKMENDVETLRNNNLKQPVDTADGTSVYDNMSSPPRENPIREKPVTIAPALVKTTSNANVGKPTTKTLPRDTRKHKGKERPAYTNNFSSTLDPKKLRDYNVDISAPAKRSPNKRETLNRSLSLERKKESPTKAVPLRESKTAKTGGADKWECMACTYLNVPSQEVCEMCGKSRNQGPEIRPLASGGRECPKCTLVNEKGVGICEACGTSLKDSPTYI
uniref:RanBP2-type domain-containing protein n=1 Tax=Timema tahoe TaxID=61484 RepID=A0A7R9FJI2_9NEOP|nr:unnamed protein product [Timema tahoe]